MKKMRTLLALCLVLSSALLCAQSKRERINLNIEDKITTTTYTSGKVTQKREVHMDFSVGDGPYKNIGKKGKEIEKVLKQDPKAYEEFKNYISITKKIKTQNILRVTSFVAMLGGAVLIFSVGKVTSEEKNVPAIAAGGAIAVAGLVGANVFNHKVDKNFEKAKEALAKSVEVYNNNIK